MLTRCYFHLFYIFFSFTRFVNYICCINWFRYWFSYCNSRLMGYNVSDVNRKLEKVRYIVVHISLCNYSQLTKYGIQTLTFLEVTL